MLNAECISKSFGEEHVLRNTSIRISPGELVGLIGSSGAGKTVLARTIIGLETWESGSIEVDHITIDVPRAADDDSWIAVRRRVGLVAQNRAVPPYRTIRELIAEGPREVLGLTGRRLNEACLPWIEKFRLGDHLAKYPAELSGGQLARVCLARALAIAPQYLICDEITSPLDPATAANVALALVDIVRSGVGVLMISHQLEFLRRHATRIDFLHAGRIVASGLPEAMIGSPPDEGLRQFISGVELGR